MNFKVLFVGAVAALSLAACQKSDSNNSSLPAPQQADGMATGYTKGTPAYSFTGAGNTMTVDGAAVTSMDDKAWEGYDGLAGNARFLSTIDSAVETTDHVLELSSGGAIVLAVDLNNDMPTVKWASNGFKAERIAYVREGAAQKEGMASVSFDLKECIAPVQQEQEQQQGKVEEQAKEEGKEEGKEQGQAKEEQNQEVVKGEPAQEQGKVEEQGKEQGQAQEQGKVEEKEQPATCRTATVVLNFTQIQEKEQEQQQGKVEEQGKEQGQAQEQGKVEEQAKEEGKEQGQAQEQGKVEEQAKEQVKEESKDQPAEQAKEQGKDEGQATEQTKG